MTTAPRPMPRHDMPAAGVAAGLTAHRRGRSMLDPRLARRRWIVALGKRLLPVAALALLCSVALWPQLSDRDHARMSYRRGAIEPQSGELTEATYHGLDDRNRPYMVTATAAHQVSPERIDLTEPKGDLTTESGSWLMARSRRGVYLQHAGNLDLSGDVQLYRDDGTTLSTESAALDLKAGAAAGAEMTHVEGPFGALDAQGFTLTDRGTVVRFSGPGKLVLNGAQSGPAPAPNEAGLEPVPPVLPPAGKAHP